MERKLHHCHPNYKGTKPTVYYGLAAATIIVAFHTRLFPRLPVQQFGAATFSDHAFFTVFTSPSTTTSA